MQIPDQIFAPINTYSRDEPPGPPKKHRCSARTSDMWESDVWPVENEGFWGCTNLNVLKNQVVTVVGRGPPQNITSVCYECQFLGGENHHTFERFLNVMSFVWKGEELQPRWWFQIFFIFTPTWGRFRFWLICFKGVETTNQQHIYFFCT